MTRQIITLMALAVLLAGSLFGNVRQWLNHREYVRAEASRQRQAVMEVSLKAAQEIASLRGRDAAELLAQLEGIAERSREVRTVYRAAAARSPLPAQCAPGRARLDAVNAGADQ